MPSSKKITIITKVRVSPELRADFADWQAKLNAAIVAFSGFTSLEILTPKEEYKPIWTIVQRFYSAESASVWRKSKEHQDLLNELKALLANNGSDVIQEVETAAPDLQGNVTQLFVTQVSPDKEEAYRAWLAKVHQAEAKFPGFRGMYVQSPHPSQGHNWITFLQFDTPENLDRWLSSSERQQVLRESESLIASFESHRVSSPYGSWFASLAKEGELPPAWKQTMIILLVLFPIVMFELKYLSPLMQNFNTAFATFIGNAISVTLIAWPMMPIAIWLLGWWLSPHEGKRQQTTMSGTLVIFVLYLLEIALLWKFL